MSKKENIKTFEFYQDCLGPNLKIICDASFMKWLCLEGKNPVQTFGCAGFDEKHVEFTTTRCVMKEVRDWHVANEHRNYSVTAKVAHTLGGVETTFSLVCGHFYSLPEDSKSCIRQLLKESDAKDFILASNDCHFYQGLQKVDCVPVITVHSGKIVFLRPSKQHKVLLKRQKGLLKEKRLEASEAKEQSRRESKQELSEELKEIQKEEAEEELLELDSTIKHPQIGRESKQVLSEEAKEIQKEEAEEEFLELDSTITHPQIDEKEEENLGNSFIPLVKRKRFKTKSIWFPFKSFMILKAVRKAD